MQLTDNNKTHRLSLDGAFVMHTEAWTIVAVSASGRHGADGIGATA
jgi:hypothetical protein